MSELLGWRHRWIQPVVCLRERATVDWVLLTKMRVHGTLVLVLRHEHVSYAILRRNVVVELLIEHDRCGVQMGIETLVLRRQVVIFLFVHLLIDDILLSHAKGATSAFLVDLRSSTCRLDARFQTAVTAARGSNVSTARYQQGNSINLG
jgi:hypothetical protein